MAPKSFAAGVVYPSLPEPGGAMLEEEEELRVWQSWTNTDESLPQPARYLQVAKETEFPLRTLWSLIQSWECRNDRVLEED